MIPLEKVLMVVCLLAGFIWIRTRARKIKVEHQKNRVILGVFVLLPALILGEKYLVEYFRFNAWTDALLKSFLILATFAAIGYGFLKSSPSPEIPETKPSVLPETAER
jgi:hypothetical protein